jgi:hypothetical protein
MTIEEIIKAVEGQPMAARIPKEMVMELITEIQHLRYCISLNSSMLAKQCDLARQAEAELAALKTEKEKPEKEGV